MEAIHPIARAETIKTNLMTIAKKHLTTLFQEVKSNVPNARLIKSDDAFIIPSADNKRQLIVTIPTTGNNCHTLCSSLMGDMSELQMSWGCFYDTQQ